MSFAILRVDVSSRMHFFSAHVEIGLKISPCECKIKLTSTKLEPIKMWFRWPRTALERYARDHYTRSLGQKQTYYGFWTRWSQQHLSLVWRRSMKVDCILNRHYADICKWGNITSATREFNNAPCISGLKVFPLSKTTTNHVLSASWALNLRMSYR